MLTLLGSFIGFLGSIIPELFRNFQDGRDKAHELKILELQMQQQKLTQTEKLEAINMQGNIQQSESLYKTFYSGNKFADSLNGLVRPTIALGFFFLYCSLKVIAFSEITTISESNIHQVYKILWNSEDAAIFAGIISFYFGTRAITKMKG